MPSDAPIEEPVAQETRALGVPGEIRGAGMWTNPTETRVQRSFDQIIPCAVSKFWSVTESPKKIALPAGDWEGNRAIERGRFSGGGPRSRSFCITDPSGEADL